MSSRSINRVILLGNLTRDPQIKYTSSGTAVATFGVATNRAWTTQDGQTKEDVQYHNIVAWQKLAELVGKLLTKGKKVYLEGRLTTRKFMDKNNVERTITEIVMDDFIVLSDGRRGDAISDAPDTSAGVAADIPPPPTTAGEQINPDDIPF
jgi:single-strand DNA-binding protein